MTTRDVGAREPHKLLLYGHHGWGKTWQARNFDKRFGKGLLLSGEAGLKSLTDADVDYLPFSSFDGTHDPDNGVFSFKGIAAWMQSYDFKALDYNWVGLDSLTELSEQVYAYAQQEHLGDKNGFALWDTYGTKMLSTLKWFRDMDMHVYVTCLASETSDVNGNPDFWPHVKGNKVAHAIPAIFDHVFCGIRRENTDPKTGEVTVRRFLVTEQVQGWHGKARDPYRRLQPIEENNDVTELLVRTQTSGVSESELEAMKKRSEQLSGIMAAKTSDAPKEEREKNEHDE